MQTVLRLRALLERLVLERYHSDLAFNLPADLLGGADKYFAFGFGESGPFAAAMETGVTDAVTFLLIEPRTGITPALQESQGTADLLAAYFADGVCYAVRSVRTAPTGAIQRVRDYGGFTTSRSIPMMNALGRLTSSFDVSLEQLDRLVTDPAEPVAAPIICCFCGSELVHGPVKATRRVYGRRLILELEATRCPACQRTYLSEKQVLAVELYEIAHPWRSVANTPFISLHPDRLFRILPWTSEDARRFGGSPGDALRNLECWERMAELAQQELDRLAVPMRVH